MGQVAVMGAEGATGARQAEGSAWGGRSLKRKSRHSGKFLFSDPMVRPDPVSSQTPCPAPILKSPDELIRTLAAVPGALVFFHLHCHFLLLLLAHV